MNGRYVLALVTAAAICVLALQRGGTANLNHRQQSSDDDLDEIEMRVSGFLRELINRSSDDAVDELLVGSPLERDEKKTTQLKDQVQASKKTYGEFLRQEQLELKRVGGSIIRAVYVLHCRRYPVIWRMTFYRATANGDWALVELRYDTDYDSLPSTRPAPALPL